MKYASVCSGIEAASVAWDTLGWKAAWFAEIEKFPSAVLAHHFPNVPNLGDMTKIKGDEHGAIDLLVGGTPCQDLSIAGKRMGFGGKRSVLALDFVRLAYESGAKWFVWENVPGVFSSNGGEDFAQLLSLFAGWQVDTPSDGWGSFGIVEQSPGCFGMAWRVVDVQYARVDGFPRAIPQRRNRVFVVGYIGDWRRAAEVLFEPEGLLGNTPPRRESGKGVADGSERGVDRCLRGQSQCSFREDAETIVFDMKQPNNPQETETVNLTTENCSKIRGDSPLILDARGNGDGVTCPTVTGDHAGRPTDYTPVVCSAVAPTLDCSYADKQGLDNQHINGGAGLFVISDVLHGDKTCNGKGWSDEGTAYTLDTMATQGVCQKTQLTKEPESFNMKGIKQGDSNASTYEADARSILSTLWEKVGEEAFSEWRFRILEAIRDEKILQSWMYGESVRCASESFRHWVLDSPLSWKEGVAGVGMRKLWEDGPDGRTPQGRELAKQLCVELGDYLQKLPQQDSQEEGSVHSVRITAEGIGLLRQALSEVQETRRSDDVQEKSAHAVSSVRRLVPVETERLMGFQPEWTRIPWRGKPAEDCPDGPRYKACGNSMGVNVMRWIGIRIQEVQNRIEETNV